MNYDGFFGAKNQSLNTERPSERRSARETPESSFGTGKTNNLHSGKIEVWGCDLDQLVPLSNLILFRCLVSEECQADGQRLNHLGETLIQG
jgi:hypothetical protein